MAKQALLKKQVLNPLLPGLLTVGTIFLAPVVDPRFIFPASYGMPLVVCLYRNLCRTGKAGDETVNAA